MFSAYFPIGLTQFSRGDIYVHMPRLELDVMEEPMRRPRRRVPGDLDTQDSPLVRHIRERKKTLQTQHSDSQLKFGGDGWFDLSLEFIKTNLKPKFLTRLQEGKLPHVTGKMMRHNGENALGHKPRH